MDPNAQPLHDDGPAVAKLFAKIDAQSGYREEVPEGMDLLAKKDGEPTAQLDTGVDADGDAVPMPVHYGRKLHESGEAAISILGNMAEAEFAAGNPRNMPEPILGWYAMTLSYQLCLLEACATEEAKRKPYAEQLRAATLAVRSFKTRYSRGVLEEIREVLTTRGEAMAKLIPGADLTYGGVLDDNLTKV